MTEHNRADNYSCFAWSSEFVPQSIDDLFYNEEEGGTLQQSYSSRRYLAKSGAINPILRKELNQNHRNEELRLFHRNKVELENKMVEPLSRIVAKNHIAIERQKQSTEPFNFLLRKGFPSREGINFIHWDSDLKCTYVKVPRQLYISVLVEKVGPVKSSVILEEKADSFIDRMVSSIFNNKKTGGLHTHFSGILDSLPRLRSWTHVAPSLNPLASVSNKRRAIEFYSTDYVVEVNPEIPVKEYVSDIQKDKWLCLDIAKGKFTLDQAIYWVAQSKDLVRTLETAQLKQVVMADFTKLTPTERFKGRKYFAQNSALFKRYLKDKGFKETFDDFAERIIGVYRDSLSKE